MSIHLKDRSEMVGLLVYGGHMLEPFELQLAGVSVSDTNWTILSKIEGHHAGDY